MSRKVPTRFWWTCTSNYGSLTEDKIRTSSKIKRRMSFREIIEKVKKVLTSFLHDIEKMSAYGKRPESCKYFFKEERRSLSGQRSLKN